jgi:hypothetical protein
MTETRTLVSVSPSRLEQYHVAPCAIAGKHLLLRQQRRDVLAKIDAWVRRRAASRHGALPGLRERVCTLPR